VRRASGPLILTLLAAGALPAWGQPASPGKAAPAAAKGTAYVDYYGNHVRFPMGDISFADEVISFTPGTPPAKGEKYNKADNALGAPNFDSKTDDGYVTLGCGGSITLHFVDNAVVDVKGDDLFLFEIPTDLEPTDVELSRDGKAWIAVGTFGGGTASIDIAKHVKPGDVFGFLRLRDKKSTCYGKWPGADVDAVGAIGSGIQLSLKSAVLFGTGRVGLRPEAEAELHRVAEAIRAYAGAEVVVDGHTDAVGAKPVNMKLSLLRAQSVRQYLIDREGIEGSKIQTRGFGPTAPIAGNETPEGRERNRRVEIVVVPPKQL
jgi:OmpA-OmpF porin, OOP family